MTPQKTPKAFKCKDFKEFTMKQNKGKSLKRLESFSSEKKPQSLEVWGVMYIIPKIL